ncbi:lipopolysaccharide transport periplasmic protein LptA [Nitrosomonas sp. Nm166]|uniref:lipopolysaccharide transport periplasmic protein LptA n=1 Tax=Nitrosomonas sp. Nm166 TaxID=1881054 RepID=UPI0008E22476|nr:lipopolysaccharide transport periplasmic protein LptA [Nitrosomonas sp. Nm166]SFE78020.1 lipopolysaccharide export system protein LptA [Nitrosomonas sp. Nm166]
MTEKTVKLILVVCLLGLFFARPVIAEKADRNKPVYLEADRATVEDVNRKEASRVSIFTGNVILTQGTMRITADKVIMKEDLNGFKHATAIGDLVTFRQKRDGLDEYVEGWSERVEYDSKTDKIELFRQARLKRGSDEVQGDYISYDMGSEFFKVIGSKERGVETGPDKRVRITIQPKKKAE